MLTQEIGKRMLRNILQAVQWISDKEYQKKAWLEGESPNDFEETSCYFFDNIDPVLIYYRLCNITEKQYMILKKFREKFEAFSDDNNWPHLFIDSPEWDEIIMMAKEVLEVFDYKDPLKKH